MQSSSLLVGYVLSLSHTIIIDTGILLDTRIYLVAGEKLIKNTGEKLVTLRTVQRRIASTFNNELECWIASSFSTTYVVSISDINLSPHSCQLLRHTICITVVVSFAVCTSITSVLTTLSDI